MKLRSYAACLLLACLIGCSSAGKSASRQPTPPAAKVLCGIDVLEQRDFDVLKGRRVAIITNHSGVTRDGRRTVDVLKNAPGVKVVAIMTPEHGLFGTKDEKIGDSVDEKTGLKVFSLYGATTRPTTQMLQGVDTIVYDIQDIGARFYTYISTLGLAVEAAGKNGVRLVVLDRPNMISGTRVEGPIADAKHVGTFVALKPIPVAHGMTVGEMANYYNQTYSMGAEVVVVPVQGWKRSMYYDQTGLKWLNPSPNMRSLDAAILYPGTCLLERTNVSVGRGTDKPFEQFGAPFVDGPKLTAELNRLNLPGLKFTAVEFTPAKGAKLGEKKCGGVRFTITDRSKVNAVEAGVSFAWALEKLFPNDFDYDKVHVLLGNAEIAQKILSLKDPKDCESLWQADLNQFIARRQKFLMYE